MKEREGRRGPIKWEGNSHRKHIKSCVLFSGVFFFSTSLTISLSLSLSLCSGLTFPLCHGPSFPTQLFTPFFHGLQPLPFRPCPWHIGPDLWTEAILFKLSDPVHQHHLDLEIGSDLAVPNQSVPIQRMKKRFRNNG